MDQYLTRKELSELLNVTERTIDIWRKDAALPCYRFGRNVKFKLDEIEQWAKERGK